MKNLKDYTLEEVQKICTARESCNGCVFKRKHNWRCRIGTDYIPSEFDLADAKCFTEEEIADAKALKRLFGYSGDAIVFRREENDGVTVNGEVGGLVNVFKFLLTRAFPSIARGESYTLDEIIGEEADDAEGN